MMNNNNVIITSGNLKSVVSRLECADDLKKYQIAESEKLVIFSSRWDYVLPGQKDCVCLSIGLSDGHELILRYPHMISMIESPENFKNWAVQSSFNLDNQSYPFIQRAKEIYDLMNNNGVIKTCGNLKSIVNYLDYDDDLIKYQILEKAKLVIGILKGK